MDLRIENLMFQYPSATSPTLKNINLHFTEGETVAIIGQNGAGKTTLVKLLNGLLKPTEGDVYAGDMNTKDFTTAKISRKVGYVYQNPDDQIFNSDVYSEVSFSPKYFGWSAEKVKESVRKAIDMTQIKEYLNEHPYNLPYSMRKLVTIACVLAMETEVVIFDEPTAGQDRRGIEVLSNIILEMKRMGKIIIIITHDMEFVVRNFDRVIVMANGTVVADADKNVIFSDNDILKQANLKKPYVARVGEYLEFDHVPLNIPDFVEKMKQVCLK